MNLKKAFLLIAKLVLTGLVLFYVFRQLEKSWAEIENYQWQIDWFFLSLSVILALLALFIFSSCWRLIIGSFGRNIGFGSSFRITYLSHLGRYIPGKIWQLFGILYLARKKGIATEEAAASFIIVQLFVIPSSLLVFAICARLEPLILSDQIAFMGTGSATALAIFMILLCSMIVFYPSPFLKGANFLLKKIGRPVTEFHLDKRVALQLFVAYAVGWIVYGLAYWMFVQSIVGSTGPSPIAAIGLYNVAYQIGYLALFAPGGFGPRELIMGLLLAPFLGPLAVAITVLARIWTIIVEIVATSIAVGIRE